MSIAQGIKLNALDILDEKHLSEGLIDYLINSGVHDFQRYHGSLRRFAPNDELTLNSGFKSQWICSRIDSDNMNQSDWRKWKGTWTNTGTGESKEKTVFSKIIHLVNPFEFMRRSHILSFIPSPDSHDRDKLRKHAVSRYNQASVDATICYMLSRLGQLGISPATIDYYETVCGIADKYYYRITDDFMTLRTKRWFWSFADDGSLLRIDGQNIPDELREWVLKKPEDSLIDDTEFEDYFATDIDIVEEEGIKDEDVDLIVNRMAASLLSLDECVAADIGDEVEEEDSEAEPEVLNRRASISVSEDEDEGDEDELKLEEFESRGGEIYLRCKDIPVLICFQEAAEGTMDELLTEISELESIDSDACGIFGMKECERQWSAWLFQVCAALSVFQRYVNFCHNDLHTNNIVWVSTTDQFIYYRSTNGAIYKVPTYGKIFKLIDFGRATAEIGDIQLISSDYEEGEDAWGQYNWGPFKDEKIQEIAPNMSFDLCRLAVSLFETLYPAFDPAEDIDESPLANLLWSWLQDDKGESILYDEEGEERFPGFDLYVHIAQHVHGAVPSKQFSSKAFSQFRWRGKAARSVPADLKLWPIFTSSSASDLDTDLD